MNKKRLPPTCTELITNILGPDGPRYVLHLKERMGGKSIFKVPTAWVLFLPDVFIVTDHRVARTVLEDRKSTKFNPFGVSRDVAHNGPSFFTEQGHRWKHVRKSTMNAFSSSNIKLMLESINASVDEWIKQTLEPSIQSDGSLLILYEMHRITCDIFSLVAFDYKLTDAEKETTLENLETCWTEFGVKAGMSLPRQFTLTRWIFPGIRKGRRAAKGMYDLCQKILHDYREKTECDQTPHKLIHMMVQNEEYKNDGERIRDMICFLSAGFDTTANTLSFALLELARHAEEQTKLRVALQQWTTQQGQEARHCPALKNVAREILRMYPALALGSVRRLGSDIEVPSSSLSSSSKEGDGATHVLPRGSIVVTPYYAIQRNNDIYQDADSFQPSRWDDNNHQKNKSTSTPDQRLKALLTFSAGSHSCQGLALANAELRQVLAKLIIKYEWHVVNEGHAQYLFLYKPVGMILSAKKVDCS